MLRLLVSTTHWNELTVVAAPCRYLAVFLEPYDPQRKPRDKYKDNRDDSGSTEPVDGAGKNVVWTRGHGNLMRLKLKDQMLDGDDRVVLYVARAHGGVGQGLLTV